MAVFLCSTRRQEMYRNSPAGFQKRYCCRQGLCSDLMIDPDLQIMVEHAVERAVERALEKIKEKADAE